MSIYRCWECQRMIDNDYHPCADHPTNSLEFICPACLEEKEEAHQDAVPDSCGVKSRTGTCFMVADHHGFHNFVEVKK
jgi:hypothetical protein